MAKNGWYRDFLTDPNTGNKRYANILYKNGKRVEQHWVNDISPPSKDVIHSPTKLYKVPYDELMKSIDKDVTSILENYYIIRDDPEDWLRMNNWYASYDPNTQEVEIDVNKPREFAPYVMLNKEYKDNEELKNDIKVRLYREMQQPTRKYDTSEAEDWDADF